MNKYYFKNILKRFVSSFTMLFFVLNFLIQDVFAVENNLGNIIKNENLLNINNKYNLNIDTLIIPSSLGIIKYAGSAGDGKNIIIHIQDAHCDYYAQRKIEELLLYLKEMYGIHNINLEGGAGSYELSLFSGINDSGVRNRVLDYFLRAGEISGPESAAIINRDSLYLWGVENPALYIENLKIYRDSIKEKEKIDRIIGLLSSLINNLKNKIFSQELMDVDSKRIEYSEGKIEFKEYFLFLLLKSDEFGINLEKFPNVFLLKQAIDAEGKIIFKQAEIERDKIIDKLRNTLSERELAEFIIKIDGIRKGAIFNDEFYEYLIKKAKQSRINLDEFPEIAKYTNYKKLYLRADKSILTREIKNLAEMINQKFYRNTDEKELMVLSENLTVIKKLFDIRFTKEDYQYYKNNLDAFDSKNYIEFIKKHNGVIHEEESIRGLDEFREKMINFYECSFKRDEAFMKNIKMGGGDVKVAILVTGGFHTDNLMELFKKNNISYVSIIPVFEHTEGYVSPYFSIISGDTGSFQNNLEKIFYALSASSNLNDLTRYVADMEGVSADQRNELFGMRAILTEWLIRNEKHGPQVLKMEDGKYIIFETKDGEPNVYITSELKKGVKLVNENVVYPLTYKGLKAIFSEIAQDRDIREGERDYLSRENAGKELIEKVDNIFALLPEGKNKSDLEKIWNALLEKKSYINSAGETIFPKGYTGLQMMRNQYFIPHAGQAIYINPASDEFAVLHELIAGVFSGNSNMRLDSHRLAQEIELALKNKDMDKLSKLVNGATRHAINKLDEEGNIIGKEEKTIFEMNDVERQMFEGRDYAMIEFLLALGGTAVALKMAPPILRIFDADRMAEKIESWIERDMSFFEEEVLEPDEELLQDIIKIARAYGFKLDKEFFVRSFVDKIYKDRYKDFHDFAVSLKTDEMINIDMYWDNFVKNLKKTVFSFTALFSKIEHPQKDKYFRMMLNNIFLGISNSENKGSVLGYTSISEESRMLSGITGWGVVLNEVFSAENKPYRIIDMVKLLSNINKTLLEYPNGQETLVSIKPLLKNANMSPEKLLELFLKQGSIKGHNFSGELIARLESKEYIDNKGVVSSYFTGFDDDFKSFFPKYAESDFERIEKILVRIRKDGEYMRNMIENKDEYNALPIIKQFLFNNKIYKPANTDFFDIKDVNVFNADSIKEDVKDLLVDNGGNINLGVVRDNIIFISPGTGAIKMKDGKLKRAKDFDFRINGVKVFAEINEDKFKTLNPDSPAFEADSILVRSKYYYNIVFSEKSLLAKYNQILRKQREIEEIMAGENITYEEANKIYSEFIERSKDIFSPDNAVIKFLFEQNVNSPKLMISGKKFNIFYGSRNGNPVIARVSNEDNSVRIIDLDSTRGKSELNIWEIVRKGLDPDKAIEYGSESRAIIALNKVYNKIKSGQNADNAILAAKDILAASLGYKDNFYRVMKLKKTFDMFRILNNLIKKNLKKEDKFMLDVLFKDEDFKIEAGMAILYGNSKNLWKLNDNEKMVMSKIVADFLGKRKDIDYGIFKSLLSGVEKLGNKYESYSRERFRDFMRHEIKRQLVGHREVAGKRKNKNIPNTPASLRSAVAGRIGKIVDSSGNEYVGDIGVLDSVEKIQIVNPIDDKIIMEIDKSMNKIVSYAETEKIIISILDNFSGWPNVLGEEQKDLVKKYFLNTLGLAGNREFKIIPLKLKEGQKLYGFSDSGALYIDERLLDRNNPVTFMSVLHEALEGAFNKANVSEIEGFFGINSDEFIIAGTGDQTIDGKNFRTAWPILVKNGFIHTMLRGIGEKASAGLNKLISEEGINVVDGMSPSALFNRLDAGMIARPDTLNKLTPNEKLWIMINHARDMEYKIEGAKYMFASWGIQKKLDPSLDYLFTLNIKALNADVKRDTFNGFILPSRSDARSGMVRASSVLSKKLENNNLHTNVKFFDSPEKIEDVISQAGREMALKENKDKFPFTLIVTLTDRERKSAERVIAEKVSPEIAERFILITAGATESDVKKGMINSSKIIAIGTHLLNYKRKRDDYREMADAELKDGLDAYGRAVIDTMGKCGFLESAEELLKTKSPDEIINAIFSRDLKLKMLDIWKDIEDSMNSMQQVSIAL
ncbi:conserved hypothetical protein, secreted [Candidatus Omnitrophus magneticus]|uniref:Uncharacterized protein n=1 Tax=Candidatus Omnitrophus magneticus TaxID=1609969 RepID=A0A0F0CMH3_9BACT|nr:conserved hypothetical protein, secreted [Candidatus Omnitrophus magneticus]